MLGYSTTSKAYRVWNLASGTLEEVHDVEFDKTNGSQEEYENLDDMRGTQLVNAMKNMDIGDIRPREVLMQKWICKHKGLIPESISKACQSI